MTTRRLRVLLEVRSGDLRMGAVNDALDLAQLLRPLGADVTLCGTSESAFCAEGNRRGITTRPQRSRDWSRRSAPLYACDVIKWRVLLGRWRPDVVHLNYAGYGPSLACAAWRAAIPVVARAGGPYLPGNAANRWVAAYAANCRQHAESLFASPLADRVVVTGDLFQPDRLARTLTPARPLPSRRDRTPRVLFLGQLVERKGLHVLLRAMALVRQPFELVLVGGDWTAGGYPATLKAMVATLGIASHVVFESHRPDAGAVLASADIVVLPSLSEARPRSVIEAMLLERAVVATAVGGLPELVRHEQTGLLVAPNDAPALAAALDRLLGDEGLRRRMGKAGRERARAECRPDRTASAYLTLYEALASRRRPLAVANA